MAPELMRGERASAASDIYSLAVMLFQLLAGDLHRPLTADWEKIIVEPLLREDLSRALASDPSERFASAEDFARQLRSLQVRRANVEERGADARVRENVAQRRRRRARVLQLLGAAAVCIILVAWIFQRQQRAAQEILKAKQENVALQNKMDEMLRKSIMEYRRTEAQIRGSQTEKTERDPLRQSIMEYPQIEARVRGSVTQSDPVAANEQIYAQFGKQLGVDPKILREKLPKFAEELRHAPNVSAYVRANASYVAKDYDEAERLALQAADEARKFVPANSKDILQALELAGLSAQKRIQYPRAMQYFREAEKLTDRNRNLEEWVTLQHEIADLLVVEGKYSDAEKLFRSVIEERVRVLGPEHPGTLDSRNRLIYALIGQTKYAEAEAEARQVLKLREKILGLEHVDTIASRYSLANTLVDQGKNTEGEALYREVISLDEKILGPEHPRTIAARSGLATVLSSEGKKAEALYREVIKLEEKVYGPEHPNTLNARQDLATTLQADQKYSEAEAQYRDVIKIDEKLIGPEHPDTLICRNNLAEMLDDAGKYAEAEAECRQIIGLEEKVLGPENLATLNSRGNLAVALIGQGKFAEAQVQYKDLLKVMERVLGFEHPDTLAYTTKIANALSRQNKTGEAMEIAKGAEERTRKILGPDNPSTQKYAKLVQALQASR
jgi:tetratricopeptide (TPR) repeat protein